MTSTSPQMPAIEPRPGTPLYLVAKESLLDAIRDGRFKTGDQLPSTKELARQLSVSLVTMHRALQELESTGLLDRKQGRGTFVADRKAADAKRLRFGLVLQPGASLADFYHSQILEGMNRAAREANAELIIMHFQSRMPEGCAGHLLLNPLPEQVAQFEKMHADNQPTLVVGARHDRLPWFDVDNRDLVHRAVEHVHQLGHRRIAYLGGAAELSNSRDRLIGFQETCKSLNIPAFHQVVIEAKSWRLDEKEKMRLNEVLSDLDHPTAIIAGGYYLALDVYQAAATLGLTMPQNLSIVGVDDPPSAEHLFPPLTTMRQPLAHLGYASVSGLLQMVNELRPSRRHQVLRAELMVRRSTGRPER